MTEDRIDRQHAFTGTKPVADQLRFDEKMLANFLQDTLPEFAGPLEVRQFKGGQSNPTYLLTTPKARYVLRRQPPGDLLPSAHAVDREYRVISALAAQNFPVPTPFVLCRDRDLIGTMFYIMAHVDGRVFWEPDMPNARAAERRAVYDAMNDCLAKLHSLNIDELGLSDFGKPEGYVARQINRWSKQYQLSQTHELAHMSKLMEWLPGACPKDARATLVHGDFRLDNIILAPERPNILAVLDWELATLGDPWGDFTYHLMQWRMPKSTSGAGTGSLVGHDLAALGIPGLDAYIALYSARTGFAVPEQLDFYFAYNFFRLAAILQGIVGRARDGTAANLHAERQLDEIPKLAAIAWDYARKAGAE